METNGIQLALEKPTAPPSGFWHHWVLRMNASRTRSNAALMSEDFSSARLAAESTRGSVQSVSSHLV
jgi:hypothetical protein